MIAEYYHLGIVFQLKTFSTTTENGYCACFCSHSHTELETFTPTVIVASSAVVGAVVVSSATSFLSGPGSLGQI